MKPADNIIQDAKEWNRRKEELLRDAADWFHEREGTLMRRRKAVEKLSRQFDIEEELARHLLTGLIEDKVDPVVQEVDGDEKKVGIIEYREGDSWYGYIHVDDIEGRKKRVICATCVEDAEKDSQVAYAEPGTGNAPENAEWEELVTMVQEHHEKEHRQEIAGVKTGATLEAGTTIGGNTAWHLGNDGEGSGLHADKVDGEENTFWAKVESEYILREGELGPVVGSFSSASTATAGGVGLDDNDSIWVVNSSDASVYKVDQEGSVYDRLPTASSTPSAMGCGVDSNGCIWWTEDLSPGIRLSCTYLMRSDGAGGSESIGMILGGVTQTGLGIDSNDSIYFVNQDGPSIYKADQSPSKIESFTPPTAASGYWGLAIDKNDCIWIAEAEDNSIYKIDRSGSLISQISSPSTNPTGMGMSTDGNLWVGEQNTSIIYEVGKPRRLFKK